MNGTAKTKKQVLRAMQNGNRSKGMLIRTERGWSDASELKTIALVAYDESL